ncbi:hypothetical protein Tco_0484406 [Tanacetum coccineum]
MAIRLSNREYPRWLDGRHAEYTDYTWVTRSDAEDRFNEVINTYPDPDEPEDGEIVPDKSTLTLAKRIKRCLKIDKLNLSKMEELKKDGYKMFGNRYMSKAEYEYNMDQMTIAMSDDMDWALDHGLGIKSKDPLPLIGPKANKKKCTFEESNFSPLNLNDIEDIYVLKIQGKLKNLEGTTGVESYQKSLNIIKPQMSIQKIKHYRAYTTCPKPFGVVHEGRDEKKKFMRGDEIHKFCDGTLTDVRDQLMNMLRLNQAVLKERRQIRRLEAYVGGRPKTGDIRVFVWPE